VAKSKSKTHLVEKCIFWEPSRSHSPLDREHIWGEWILQYVRSKDNKHSLKSTTLGGPGALYHSQIRPRAGDPLASKVKIVCKACNSGWMSRLQSGAKPALIPLIEGRPSILSASAQGAIAAWCAMSTMTGEFLSFDPTAIAISQAERDWLRDFQTPPKNWKIWIGHYPRRKGIWTHYVIPLRAKDIFNVPDDPLALPNTQTTTFVIGNLFVHIFSSIGDPQMVSRWVWPPGSLISLKLPQIFPPKEDLIAWPPQGLTDFEVELVETSVERVFAGARGENPLARAPHRKPRL
jgi:hypothetical protein